MNKTASVVQAFAANRGECEPGKDRMLADHLGAAAVNQLPGRAVIARQSGCIVSQ